MPLTEKLFYDKAKREYQGSDKRQPVGTANAQLRSLLWPDNAENVQPNIKLTEAEKKKMYNSITNSVQYDYLFLFCLTCIVLGKGLS